MASKKKTPQDKKKLAVKKKKLEKKKKKLEKIEQRLKRVDKDLIIIEKELRLGEGLRSKVVDADLKRIETRLMHLDFDNIEGLEETDPPKFYRKFVFKCKKCKSGFDKNIKVPPIKKRITCPSCGRDHTLGLYPSSRFYNVEHSQDIVIIKVKR